MGLSTTSYATIEAMPEEWVAPKDAEGRIDFDALDEQSIIRANTYQVFPRAMDCLARRRVHGWPPISPSIRGSMRPSRSVTGRFTRDGPRPWGMPPAVARSPSTETPLQGPPGGSWRAFVLPCGYTFASGKRTATMSAPVVFFFAVIAVCIVGALALVFWSVRFVLVSAARFGMSIGESATRHRR